MTAADDHYEFLGLQASASQETIEATIERVAEQAIALVYTSPERSADLWDRIRQMRRDLLATPEGRQVYDEALLRRKQMAGQARVSSVEIYPALRPPSAGSPIPAPNQAPMPAVSSTSEEKKESAAIAWPYALVAAAAVFALVVGALVSRAPGTTPLRRPVAMTLSQLGTVHASKFASGGSVSLAWTAVPHATTYRVQVVTMPGDPSDSTVFAHGGKTFVVATPHYHLRVTGPQLYYWRVQARVGGRWQRYTPSLHFAVAKPRISQPMALAPVSRIGSGGKHVRLCWSPVRSAVGYRLRIQGQSTRTVHNTCITLSVRPRTYHWSVAALVRGVGVYAGTYSVAAVLHVPAKHRPTSSKHVSHRSTRRSRSAHHRSQTGRTHARRHTASGAVEVAAAIPQRSASSSAGTSPRFAKNVPVVTVSGRKGTVFASGRTKRSRAGARHLAKSTTKRAGLPTPLTARPVHPASARRHAPVVASKIPAPPPVPAPSTGPVTAAQPASTAVPIPTQGVSATGGSSSAPISVHPIVASPIAYNTPRPSTPPTPAPTSAAVLPTSPPAGNTKAAVPVPTAAQTNGEKHPDHAEKPPHPDQPKHP